MTLRLKRSQESVQPFRLLGLPAELRNLIYEYCVTSDESVLLPATCEPPGELPTVQPPVTKVCRQIRQEALPLFYECNKFEAFILGCDFRHLIRYAEFIGPEACENIGDVTLLLGQYWGMEIGCGTGLWDLVCWYALSDSTPPQFHLSGAQGTKRRRAIFDAITLATNFYNNNEASERKLRLAFDEWLKEKDLECRCVQPGVTRYCSEASYCWCSSPE